MVITLAVLVVIVSPTPAQSFELLKVQEGFSKQLIASEPQVMDPVSFCFDEQGNILVAESFRQENAVPDNRSSPFWLADDLQSQTLEDRLAMYEYWADQRVNGMDFYTEFEDRIRRLEDIDGDGVFETSTIVADGFNDPLDGTGAGLLVIDGDIWFTSIPSLWRLRDTNNDGYAETRESIFRGFGIRIALRGHDLHGLALGLDGRLYWSLGDRGYHLELEDGSELHSPGEGGVFRCNLDGTKLELFHNGLRNPQELAFDKYGNLFTGDNNSDAGDKARLVYCVEGGETGWRMEYQTLEGENKRGPWVQENGWDPHADNRPAWILPAIDTIGSGPSGLVSYPGGGLSNRYEDHFFMCNFLGTAEHSNVLSFAVEPSGAHFKMVDLHTFVDGVLCTDVDFGYNGRMVISDWGEGWQGNFEGRLYSVWDEAHVDEGDVSGIFAYGFERRTSEELILMLFHVDRRVRIRSQYELAKREATEELVGVLSSDHQLAKIHAMWALAMMSRDTQLSIAVIAPLLYDVDPEIRAQACRILGEARFLEGFERIVELIDDPTPRVSYFATIASGHLGNALDSIIEMLERNNNEDVYLRHAGVVALAQSQYASAMANLQTHPSSAVRLAAVLVLRKLGSVFTADFLEDPDDAVATEAARAIHDGRIYSAMDDLAKSLLRARTIPWQKRAISANKMARQSEESVLVATFAADANNAQSTRILAMQALRNWDTSSQPKVNRDIVEGRVDSREYVGIACIGNIQSQMESLLQHSEGDLLLETLQFANETNTPVPDELVSTFVRDELMPINIRTYLLQQSASFDLLEYALQSEHWQLRARSRDVSLEQGSPNAIHQLLETVDVGEVYEAQQAVKSLATVPSAFSKIDSVALRDELKLEYSEASSLEFDSNWLLSGGNPSLGKEVVLENARSECLRCHIINGHGGIAGPSLDGVGNRLSWVQMREALLVPSSDVAEGFGEYSAMPPMGVLLDHRELRDVIAYLKTLQ